MLLTIKSSAAVLGVLMMLTSATPANAPRPEAPVSVTVSPGDYVYFALELRRASLEFGVPEALLWAIIHTESNFDIDAISSAGAIGLGQLMPGTARRFGADPFAPVSNIRGMARYMRFLLDRFRDPMWAIAAYNCGENREAVKSRDWGSLPAETRGYVPVVIRNWRKWTRLGIGVQTELNQ